MNHSKLHILFVIDKTNVNTKGKAPLRCRLTYSGKRKVFSTGLFIISKQWDSKQQLIKPPNKENTFINTSLSLIKNEINQAFLFLQVNGDKEKQLYYIDRFLKVDKKLDEQFRYLSTELHQKYDTPNLLQEKEVIINELKNKKTFLYVSVSILTLILLLLTYFYYKTKKAEKEHRKIAQDLIHLIEKRNLEAAQNKNDKPVEIYEPVKVESETKTIKTVPEDVAQSILRDLDNFENKLHFLKNGITLTSLAKNIKTNTAYLSEIINNHKGKNFTTYLNDLRIDYALDQLVKDKKFRSYKLPAIAEEIGYNNVQAFSIAFKKKTGTTPSIYIKEMSCPEIAIQKKESLLWKKNQIM